MLPLYHHYDHLTSEYTRNFTRLQLLTELTSELSLRDHTNHHLIDRVQALQEEN
jgi:hypothetical protein